MSRRLLASSALVLSTLVPALSLADVPPADGGAGGGTTTSTTPDGGAVDADCTVAKQSIAGTSCAECAVTSSDTSCSLELGGGYSFACQQSATVQVWCDGPPGTSAPAAGCSLGSPPAPLGSGDVGLAALLGLAAVSVRRRRR